jgi:hypothetical protein
MKEQVYLLERCCSVLLHGGPIVEVAYELVGDDHVLAGLRAEGIMGETMVCSVQ